MHARALWASVVGFLCGVALRSFLPLPWPFAAFFFLIAAIALVMYAHDRGKKSALVLAIACIAFGSGFLRTSFAVQAGDPVLSSVIGKSVSLTGRIVAEPDVRDNGVRLTVAADHLIAGSSMRAIKAGVLVLAPPHVDARYGDEIRATGTLKLPEAFDTTAGRTFDYPMYLAKDGVLYQLAFARVEATGETGGNPLQKAAIALKQAYLRGLQSVLPEPEAGFAGGITVGDKRSIGSDLSATFQKVSLIHMVVLSGYNITVVINAAGRLLAWGGRTV